MTVQPSAQPAPEPDDDFEDEPREMDSVDRRVRSIFYEAFNRAHGYTRMPGSVVYDENGEVA